MNRTPAATVKAVLWGIERAQALLARADHWRRMGEALASIQLAVAAGELLWELGQGFEPEAWFVDELEEVGGAVEVTDDRCHTRETQALSRAVCRWIEARRPRQAALVPLVSSTNGGLTMDGVVYLHVPLEDQFKARSLGARWDGKRRSWYVPQGLALGPFARWLPDDPELAFGQSLESPLCVLEATTVCWQCGAVTPVIAIGGYLPPEDYDPEEGQFVVLCQVRHLPAKVAAHLATRYPSYRLDRSSTVSCSYFMNHCDCGACLEDFDLHLEPGTVFFPVTQEEAAQVSFRGLSVVGTFEFEVAYLSVVEGSRKRE
jgi:Domain of unknown function (DUF5710)